MHATRFLIHTFSLCFVFAPRSLAQDPPAGAGTPAAREAQPEIDLAPEIDKALRWLRYEAQDASTGGYGGVESTAWVLRALVESPRRYRRVDGPFVERALQFLMARQEADGSIHDPGAPKEEIARQTSLAAAALALHQDEVTQAAISKAQTFVAGAAATAADPFGDEPLPTDKKALKAKIDELLAKRNAQGVWESPGKPALATAKAVSVLDRAFEALKPGSKPALAAVRLPEFQPVGAKEMRKAIEDGARFLASLADEQGRFAQRGRPDPGLTAMGVGGLLSSPVPRDEKVQKAIDGGLAWLVSLQKPDGSIHDGKLANYVTSASILALVRAGRPEHRAVVERARDFLVQLQNDGEEGYTEHDLGYGGIGYGSSERPDLSNLQIALDALSASGLPKDHEAFQRALVFLERCQNLPTNDLREKSIYDDSGRPIVPGDDGGAGYLPGQSFAGYVDLEGGKRAPRSYGSMTYALLKGYALVGLPKDDPRMKAAWEWLRKNFTLDGNPGFPATPNPAASYQGLFYYFHTMAKALALYGEETVVDGRGKEHEWRRELGGRLVAMQRPDGSWVNENSDRWWEGNPMLATAYALLVLGETMPPR